jgi:hypothetical protein
MVGILALLAAAIGHLPSLCRDRVGGHTQMAPRDAPQSTQKVHSSGLSISNQAEAAAVHSEWEVSLRRVHSHDRTHPQVGEGLPFVIVTPCVHRSALLTYTIFRLTDHHYLAVVGQKLAQPFNARGVAHLDCPVNPRSSYPGDSPVKVLQNCRSPIRMIACFSDWTTQFFPGLEVKHHATSTCNDYIS